MAYLNHNELNALGLKEFGDNVLISDKASFYNPSQIKIGSNVRIDDFCILSAGEDGIEIKNYIHIAAYASLIGAGKIIVNDFCGISSRVSIYSSSDDYSGGSLTNPMVPDQFKNVTSKDVNIGKHVIIGSGSVVLPGVTLEEGAAIGALSLVTNSCKAYGIYAGQPAKRIKERKQCLKQLEKNLPIPKKHEPKKTEISGLIFKGIKKTVDDLFYWTGDDLTVEFPEYSLTTNIAHEVSKELNITNNHTIYLEKKTRQIIKQSVKHHFNSPFYKKKKSNFIYTKESIRNGRVDIAIIKNDSFIGSLKHIIEVKGINPSQNGIRKDLKRLQAFINLKNQHSGSTIDSCYFSAIHRYKTEKDFSCNDLKKKYQKIATDIGLKSEEYIINIEKIKNETEIDHEINEFIGSIYVVGVVLEIHKKNHITPKK